MSRKTRKEKSHGKKLINALDIPEVINPTLPHIEAEGNREFAVDGCKGILEYEEDCIKINTGGLIISFKGSDLEIKVYSDIQTVIVGNIMTIDFEN